MAHYPPPKYVMLNDPYGNVPPPQHRRNVPRYHSSGRRSGARCCLRCLCCCYCCLFFLIFAIAAVLFYFFYVYQPKIPTYEIQNFETDKFDMGQDTLYTEFVVTVKADNPNRGIGFNYGSDSTVDISYKDSNLCNGTLPAFHQGPNNVTVMNIYLKGNSSFGSSLHEAFKENQNSGRIPIVVAVTVPMSIQMGDHLTREVNVGVICALVVDKLEPNKKTEILSNLCIPHFNFGH